MYVTYQVAVAEYVAKLPSANPPKLYTPPPETVTVARPIHVLQAWDDMWRVVARAVPFAGDRTKALRGRIRQLGHR